jgi:hypothetical protein
MKVVNLTNLKNFAHEGYPLTARLLHSVERSLGVPTNDPHVFSALPPRFGSKQPSDGGNTRASHREK